MNFSTLAHNAQPEMSPTYRIFEKDATVSVATAVRTKTGIFQVKPEKKGFATLEEWMENVGLSDGRRMEAEGQNPPKLTADQMFVAKAVTRARAKLGCKSRVQYLCYPSLRKKIDAIKQWIQSFEKMDTKRTRYTNPIWNYHKNSLVHLEARAATNPSQLDEPVYKMAIKPKPMLYVKADDGLLPIYYSKDFKKISIRLTNGNLVDTFYDAGINTDYALPVFYAMSSQQVLMPVPDE
jgi:uncharacterized protein YdhG (YjbR/CyaY superfamily)